MITKPPIDELTEIAKNKYVLCCALSKRAKQITELQAKDEIPTDLKPISYAAEELYAGKIKIVCE